MPCGRRADYHPPFTDEETDFRGDLTWSLWFQRAELGPEGRCRREADYRKNFPKVWLGKDRTSSGRSASLEVCQQRRMTWWLVPQRDLQEVAGRAHDHWPHDVEGLHASFRCPEVFAPAWQPDPQGPWSPAICRGRGPPRQVGPRLHPAPLQLLPPPPPTPSGPGLDGRWGHLAKLAFGLSPSQGESSLLSGLRSTDLGLERTRHHFQNARTAFLPIPPILQTLDTKIQRG